MDCIFCKLANGEIPTATLYEDDEFRVILDQGPATKGHALILPKQHFANIYEIPDETAAKAMILGKKMSKSSWRKTRISMVLTAFSGSKTVIMARTGRLANNRGKSRQNLA